jgi:Domain of unknown function (DUF4111)
LDNGSLQFELSNHDNTNVVRWSLRHHGVVLAGPPVPELIDEVSSEVLKDEIGAVNRNWVMKYCCNGWLQPYPVLSFCRMLHSLTIGTIESKAAGARWAVTALMRAGMVSSNGLNKQNAKANLVEEGNWLIRKIAAAQFVQCS